MNLDTFIQGLEEEVAAFRERYREGIATDPDNWPEEMNLADWWDQFIAHVDLENRE